MVRRVVSERPGFQELLVAVGEEQRPAVSYPPLVGRVREGDRVILNSWAVEMGLGTGGYDFVCQVEMKDVSAVPAGHIMKLRYTPLQLPVLAVEAPESEHHQAMADFRSLEETPVVCAELHSQVPAIASAIDWETQGRARIVYVMTEGGALPITFSHTVADLKARGLLHATVTCGHAFGGDFEAVNIYSALAAARVAGKADVIVVSQGPGGAGTDTPLGFSGVEQGIALNAVAALDGTPIAVARLSFADKRKRHLGISHHTRTVLERIALCPVLVPIPRLPQIERYYLKSALESADLPIQHEFVTVDADRGLKAMLDRGVEAKTMGRRISDDRAFFLASAAAGLLAGQWVRDAVGCED